MALNPISWNTGGGKLTPNLAMTSMLSQEIHMLLSDTASIRNSGYVEYAGSINSTGAAAIDYRMVGLNGRDLFRDAGSEISDESANMDDLTDEATTITVARSFLIRELGDLGQMVGYGSPSIDPFLLAEDMSKSYEAKFMSKVCTAAAGFTTIKGNNTDKFSTDLFFECMLSLERSDTDRGAPPPYALIIHPKSLGELRDSLRNETSNVIAMAPATLDMMKTKGAGYAGNLLGVDIFRSSHVTEAGSAKENYMIARGAIAYADGAPTIIGASDTMAMQDAKIVVEFDRKPAFAISRIIGHMWCGVAVVRQTNGVLCKAIA
jgi:hypothetical protein